MLKQSGVTIVLTTHYMDEAYQICDELIIMHQGEKILGGRPRELIREHMEAYVLEIQDPRVIPQIDHNGLRHERTATRLLLYAQTMEPLQDITRQIDSADFFLRPSNLEDLFLKVTGRRLND